MRRISDEDGREAGSRNAGRLALAVIPAALGGAAVLWVLAASGYIDINKQRRAEERALHSVGLQAEQVGPIRFESSDAACLKIDDAHLLDGQHFVFYAKNVCQAKLEHPTFTYAVMSSDRTVLESEFYTFDGKKSFSKAERREQPIWIQHGTARAATIRIEVSDD